MHFPRVAALNEQMTETKKKYFLMFLVRFSNSLFSEYIGKRAPVVGKYAQRKLSNYLHN